VDLALIKDLPTEVIFKHFLDAYTPHDISSHLICPHLTLSNEKLAFLSLELKKSNENIENKTAVMLLTGKYMSEEYLASNFVN